MPDVHLGIGNRRAVQVHHFDVGKQRFAGRPKGQITALRNLRCVVYMEGAEHRGFGGTRWMLMIQSRDQHRHAQRVRQQDELLPLAGAHVARRGEKADGLLPLGLGQVHVAHEVVQVLHERRHHAFEARVGTLGEAGDHRFGDVVFVDVAHVNSPSDGVLETGSSPACAVPSRKGLA